MILVEFVLYGSFSPINAAVLTAISNKVRVRARLALKRCTSRSVNVEEVLRCAELNLCTAGSFPNFSKAFATCPGSDLAAAERDLSQSESDRRGELRKTATIFGSKSPKAALKTAGWDDLIWLSTRPVRH